MHVKLPTSVGRKEEETMINAKEEVWEEMGRRSASFKGAVIVRYGEKAVFEPSQLKEFLQYMNFVYDEGYGEVSFRGFVLLEEGWLERDSYDGNEWWVLRKRPALTDDI
jgi:hypothetical protein